MQYFKALYLLGDLQSFREWRIQLRFRLCTDEFIKLPAPLIREIGFADAKLDAALITVRLELRKCLPNS